SAPITLDQERRVSGYAARQMPDIARTSPFDLDGFDRFAERSEMRYRFGRVTRTSKREQADLVALRDVAQGVVGPDFRTGVKRVRQDLGQKQHSHPRPTMRSADPTDPIRLRVPAGRAGDAR